MSTDDRDDDATHLAAANALTAALYDACDGYDVEDVLSAGLAMMIRVLSVYCEGDPYANLIEAAQALEDENAARPNVKANAPRVGGLN